MKNNPIVFVFMILLIITIPACGSEGKSTGDTQSGEDLFSKPILGSQAGCKTCHSLEEGVVIVGPSMSGIATRTASQEPGKSVEKYLREAIVDPNAVIVTEFPPNVMPKDYEKELTPEQIDSLVAFLMTLK